MGWPIIGHMPYINPSNPYSNVEYYTKKYGPVFRIKLGSYEVIVINDYTLIKKAFSREDFISLNVYYVQPQQHGRTRPGR